jgi:hypothetical protein
MSKCNCMCHEDDDVEHCFPCCWQCTVCGENIIFGYDCSCEKSFSMPVIKEDGGSRPCKEIDLSEEESDNKSNKD